MATVLSGAMTSVPARLRTGRIHSVETCGAVDGPGLRYVVFTQGCLLRCRYCHNPDTWALQEGRVETVENLMRDIESYIPFMQFSGGGVTVTGGEPLLQPDFVAGLFEECHKRGIHTALDSNGFQLPEKAMPALEHTDLVLLDLKQLNPKRHRALTSVDHTRILSFARLLSDLEIPMWIRYVVVPGWSDAPEDVELLADFVSTLNGVEKVELLPYHLMGKNKWEVMGLPYTLEGVEPPTQEVMERIRRQLTNRGLKVG